jgi:putative ribosome biogenesis GTPase RsgA
MIIRLKLLFSVIGSMADLLERMRKEMMSFSIMLVGYSGAGKSSLINRYV